jgi:hypothetical protein
MSTFLNSLAAFGRLIPASADGSAGGNDPAACRMQITRTKAARVAIVRRFVQAEQFQPIGLMR